MSDDFKRLLQQQKLRVRDLIRDEPDPTRGRPGAQGEQGVKGDRGEQGEQGIQGPKGDRGARGPQGEQGIQGILGVSGPQGLKGDRGQQGERGVPGLTARKGDKGDKGDRGERGAKGDKGDTGSRGLDGVGLMGLPGPPGKDGEDGSAGPKGSDGGPASKWRSGVGAPADGFGSDGDWYLQEDTADIYHWQNGTYSLITNIRGPRGSGGGVGADGKPGVAFRSGAGAPPSAASQRAHNGDLYLRTSNNNLYQVLTGSYVYVATLGGGSGTTLPIRVITNPVALLSDVAAGTSEVLQLPSGALGLYANEAGVLKYVPFITAPLPASPLKYFHAKYFKSRMSYGFGGKR